MRILLIRPCCIGDVVLATAALSALRQTYPEAHITWAVGGWSRRAVEYHPALDAILDTGQAALPVKSVTGFGRFVRQLRSGHYDLAVSLVRSPLMSAAVWLSRIPQRAGIDSHGRGFGYNVRAPVNPAAARHEAEIYLDVVRTLGAEPADVRPNLPVLADARESVQAHLANHGIHPPYVVINPAGGGNPGMAMHSKRWPLSNMARMGDWLAQELGATLVLLAGPDDTPLIDTLQDTLQTPSQSVAGLLSFPEIGALAADSALYLGNDTGLTHLAAASGARTVMVLGPSDPRRYAPYTANSLALWKPVELAPGGVATSHEHPWDWERDGIGFEAAQAQIRAFLDANS